MEFHSQAARRLTSRSKPLTWKKAFLVPRLHNGHFFQAPRDISCRREALRLTHPALSTLPIRRSGSCYPLSANRALTVFAPSTSLQVGTRRVSTKSFDWAPIFSGGETLNFPRASKSPTFALLTRSAELRASSSSNSCLEIRLHYSATDVDDSGPPPPTIKDAPGSIRGCILVH